VLFSAPLARLPEFILGAVLARLVHLGHWHGPGLTASSAIAVTGYILASAASAGFNFAACTIIGFALLIPAAAVADLHDLRSVWRHPALVRLGELSFAFYMVHILVLHAGSAALATLPAPTGAAAALTASLALSWLIHQGVERPARQLILARAGPPVPARAAGALLPDPRLSPRRRGHQARSPRCWPGCLTSVPDRIEPGHRRIRVPARRCAHLLLSESRLSARDDSSAVLDRPDVGRRRTL